MGVPLRFFLILRVALIPYEPWVGLGGTVWGGYLISFFRLSLFVRFCAYPCCFQLMGGSHGLRSTLLVLGSLGGHHAVEILLNTYYYSILLFDLRLLSICPVISYSTGLPTLSEVRITESI